ncbi:MAG: hypothetical protein JNL96_07400 [Planctomycetaceae bacterium]|nr:hypothetical protein [Planctomycetaceae bacterium]
MQRRKTTINHAFASALAPCDSFEMTRLAKAMKTLGQTNVDDLRCTYCGAEAQTWDHLVGLVKASQLNGYGHQVGNLVPCCKPCNSKKGNQDWKAFIRKAIPDATRRTKLESRIKRYLAKYAKPVDLSAANRARPKDWRRYVEIRNSIFELMKEADRLAEQLRLKVT